MELGQLAALEGSLFDSLLALLDRLKGDMMGRLLDWTMREFKEKAKPYSQNRYNRNLGGGFGPLCWALGSKSLDVCGSGGLVASSVHCGPARLCLLPPSGTVAFNRLRIYITFFLILVGGCLFHPSRTSPACHCPVRHVQ